MQQGVADELEQLLHKAIGKSITLEVIETNVRNAALRITAHIIEQTLNADKSDYHGPAQRCSCGSIAAYYGRRPKTILSVVGELTLSRAYYYCSACEQGFYPRDLELGLDHGSLSGGLLKMVGATAALVSFQESDELLRELRRCQ